MRKALVFSLALATALAVVGSDVPARAEQPAQTTATAVAPKVFPVKFLPPPELANKPGNPTPPPEATFTLYAVVQAVNAQTNQPYSLTFPVRSFTHEAGMRDPQSGLPTGHRMHKPLVLVKELDEQASLIAAAARHDTIKLVTLVFRPHQGGDGTTQHAFLLTGVEFTAVAIKPNPNDKPTESVSFTYGELKWTYTKGGVTKEDSWPPKS